MPGIFKINPPVALENSAAMAIHDEFLYFIEIDENNEVTRKITIPLADGCIVNGQIKNFALLESAFVALRRETGKIHEPVSIGIPEGEVIIRFPTLPDMSLEDVRGTLDLNFTEFFPYPRNEAVFDTVKIKTPNDDRREDITVLAAAARSQTVDHILSAAHNAGIPPGPVEPVNFAMIRAIPEAYEGLCVLADRHNIVAVWEGNGIFFRTGNNENNIQDILNTIQYIETQYRSVRVSKIILAKLDFQISTGSDDSGSDMESDAESDSGLKVINVDDEYYSARGLALRNDPAFLPLDMRPAEFIELEKRRYSFNPNRLILWGLIVIFLMLSIGTISFTFACIRDMEDKINIIRESVADLTPQRTAIVQENAELERQNAKTENLLKFLQGDIPVLEIMKEFEENAGNGVKFETADFTRNLLGGFAVTIDGKAEDERAVVIMTEGLKAGGKFSGVMLPVSQRDQTGRIVFKLVLNIGEIENETETQD
ncbi:MAG: pilus assembly protein PilM [Synergistaceae bacterium]|nr:pilus assembly protein PilM [Synergistaceae bacterium]